MPASSVLTQSTWVEKKREERKKEFAPPCAYQSDRAGKTPVPQHRQPVISEDSIAAGLAFIKHQQSFNSNVQHEVVDLEEDLSPPGESLDMNSRWHPQMSTCKKAAVPPPTSMDYYATSSYKNSSFGNKRSDLSESFRMGLQNSSTENKAANPP